MGKRERGGSPRKRKNANGQFFLCEDTLFGYVAPDEHFVRPVRVEALLPVLYEREKSGWQPVQVEIPQGITAIGPGAFEACYGLTSVVIPDTVVSIGREAFCNCSSLTHIRIPSGVREISRCAFQGCAALTEVVLPDGVRAIGVAAFCNCTSLTRISIPDTVETIGTSAFYRCPALREIRLPAGLHEQARDAFGPDLISVIWRWLGGTLEVNVPMAEVLAESVREQRTEIWEQLVSQGDERMLERYLVAWDQVPLDFLDELIEASLKAKRPEYTAVLLRYKRDRYLQG